MYFLVVITILSAGICYHIARGKGLKVQNWVVLAALVGPFAIPFVWFAKPANGQDAQSE